MAHTILVQCVRGRNRPETVRYTSFKRTYGGMGDTAVEIQNCMLNRIECYRKIKEITKNN
jgi:hypothetical protein